MVTDFLALDDLGAEALMPILSRSAEMAAHWRLRQMPQKLAGLNIALIVDDSGWRNTTAFELGIQAMGGRCVRVPITFRGSEAVADLAAYLDNWFDIIVARTPDLSHLRKLAQSARAPVINARTRSNHPCETLGDLAFMLAARGTLDRLRVAVVSPDDNILGSWAEAAAALPLTVVQVYPKQWHATRFNSVERFSHTTDIETLASADIVITDCWPKNAQASDLVAYQITPALLERLAPKAFFIPCPPVTRGQEVSSDAMDMSCCRVIEAKSFLLHAQNSLLACIAENLK